MLVPSLAVLAGESFVSEDQLGAITLGLELECHLGRGVLVIPLSGVYQLSRWLHDSVGAAHMIFLAAGLAHVNPVTAAYSEIDLDQRNGHRIGCVPALQLLRRGPRLEELLRRDRVDPADLELGYGSGAGGGHTVFSLPAVVSRYVAS
jgi:hypothetical protein